MKTLPFKHAKIGGVIGVRMAKGKAADAARGQAEFESFQRKSKVQAFSQTHQGAINVH